MTQIDGTPFVLGANINKRYKIISRLKKDLSGPIFKARDLELETDIFLMVFYPNISTNPKMLNLIKKEFLLARKISHENILKVFSFDNTDNFHFVTMQNVEGIPFSDFLLNIQSFEIQDLLRISFQFIDALLTAHSYKVFHTTIHEENIIVDNNNNINLINFGFHNEVFDHEFSLNNQQDLEFTKALNKINQQNIIEFGLHFKKMIGLLTNHKKSSNSFLLNKLKNILHNINKQKYSSIQHIYDDLKSFQSKITAKKQIPKRSILVSLTFILLICIYFLFFYYPPQSKQFNSYQNLLIGHFLIVPPNSNIGHYKKFVFKKLNALLSELTNRKVIKLEKFLNKSNSIESKMISNYSPELLNQNQIQYIIDGVIYKTGTIYQISFTFKNSWNNTIVFSERKAFKNSQELLTITEKFVHKILNFLKI